MFVERNYADLTGSFLDLDHSVHLERGPVTLRSVRATDDARPRAFRHELSQSARLRIANCRFNVETIDISEAGAKLDLCGQIDGAVLSDAFAPGTIVLLTVKNMGPQLCEIRWCTGSTMGLRFRNPCPADTLRDLLAASPSPADHSEAGRDII